MIGRRISHYLLEELLGVGGMGEVYRACDLALGRTAAVKVLPAGFAPELRERLLREARASARLQHPAIATFYEAGEADGAAFIAMEHVRGETLRERLRRGPLPADEAVGVAATLLAALSHAHSVGVVHRDIKLENVMLTGGGAAKLLDFGLAKRLPDGDPPPPGALTLYTVTGVVMGTPGYMAPEQTRGEAVDARTDLFALGAVLYEALTGRPAFAGGTALDRAAAAERGIEARALEEAVPEGLRPILARALAPRAADRYASAAAFLAELQQTAEGSRPAALPQTLAIVDFENLSRDPADEWIGSATAESLAAELGRVDALETVAREKLLRTRAGLAAAAAAVDPLSVGQALGCRWVLSGGFQMVGEALRLTARLAEVATGRILMTEKIDGAVGGIFEMQDRIAAAAVRALPLAGGTGPQPAGRPPALAAYEHHARAQRFFYRLEKGSFDQAATLLEQAIAGDPTYAAPYAGLAAVHAMRFTFRTEPGELDLAARFAQRAIELDPDSTDAHVWLSYALWRRGEPDASLRAAERVMALAPGQAYGPYFAACGQWSRGRRQEARALYQRALQIDPTHGFAWMLLGCLCAETDEFDEARWGLQRAIDLEGKAGLGPTAGTAAYLGEVFRRQGRLAEARAACMAGIESAERSDHMYRDTMRAVGLTVLGRTALDQGDAAGALAAFAQAEAHLRGRPRTLGGGHLMAQALAGTARAGGGEAPYAEALAICEQRDAYDFHWLWLCTDDVTLSELARAALALGRPEEAARLAARARLAGAPEAGPEAAP